MSGLSQTQNLSYPSLTLSHRPAALSPVAAVGRLIADWITLRRTTRAMEQLDDRLRADIGLAPKPRPAVPPQPAPMF